MPHHILPERSFVLFDVEADASLSLFPASIASRRVPPSYPFAALRMALRGKA
jgi:hypothetical protein